MNKAEQFIKDCTRSCSNLDVSLDSDIVCSYAPWLTPEQALAAVEIAREEMIDTLKMKGVDLEKEFFDWYHKESTNDHNASILYERYSTISKKLAKHFFELGLKAKGK